MKTGLVLEGGAMRGLFTAGVLDAWYQAGVRFDGIIGVSAGAVFGCNYKSGQPGRVLPGMAVLQLAFLAFDGGSFRGGILLPGSAGKTGCV